MIPTYPIAPDGVCYVPSLVAPSQILLVSQAQGQVAPLSQKDLYFLQRLHIPLGQTWIVNGLNPPTTHMVQMGMLPPMSPSYSTTLIGPQEGCGPQQFQPPSPPSDLFDPLVYEADVSNLGSDHA